MFWSHEFSITDRLKGEETTEVVSKVEKMKCCDSVVTVVQFCYMNKGYRIAQPSAYRLQNSIANLEVR